MASTNNTYKTLLGLLLIIGFVIYLIFSFITEGKKMSRVKKDGVYVVARVESFEKRNNGRIFHYQYSYKEEEYTFSIKALGSEYSIGDLVFVLVSASNPNENYYDEDDPRPGPCITYENSPPEGWKEIPICK